MFVYMAQCKIHLKTKWGWWNDDRFPRSIEFSHLCELVNTSEFILVLFADCFMEISKFKC